MPVDVNTYALSVSLAFDAGDAFKTLDDFGQKVTNLESDVSTAAQNAIKSLGTIAAESDKYLTDIGKSLADIGAKTLKVETNLGEATKELKDQYDTGEDHLKNLKIESDIQKKLFKLQEDLTKELELHTKLDNEFLEITNKVIAAVKLKNHGHAEQNSLLENDVALGSSFLGTTGEIAKSTHNAAKQAAFFAVSWRSTWAFIKAADADTEKFVATNYRLYDSQQALLQSARSLTMTQGVFYKDAVEAYAVMGNLSVPSDELDKYAEIVAKTSRATQVGIMSVGEYTNRLRIAGFTTQQTERQLAFMTEAMRKFGLSSADTQKIMSGTATETLRAKSLFGGSAKEIEKFEQSKVIMAGFAKSVGLGAEASQEFHSWLISDAMAMRRFGGYAGVAIKGVESLQIAQLKGALRTEEEIRLMEEQVALGKMDASAMKIRMKIMQDMWYGGSEAAMQASRAMGVQARSMKLTGANVAEYNQLMKAATDQINDPFSEANRGLTAQLRMLKESFGVLFDSIGAFIGNALIPLLQILNQVIRWTMSLGMAIANVVNWFEQIPILGRVVSFLKWTIGIVLALGIALAIVGVGIISFGMVLGRFSLVLGWASAGVQALAGMVLIVARAFGQAIIIILASIGRGLQMLGMSVQSVMAPLLALGAAFLMVGIGSYFFALGVRTIAEMGWVAIPAILGMIAAIALLGAVLIILSGFIQGPIAIGLIVLSIAILAIGAAALMMGFGVNLAAQGFVLLADVLSFSLIAKFTMLGLAIVALGAMATLAIPGLFALSAALVVIAIAAMIIAGAFYIVAAAIKMIGTDAIPALAHGFMSGALYMAAAAGILIVASSLMIVAAGLLALAVVSLLPTTLILMVVGLALSIGSGFLMAGGVLLLAASAMILVGGLAVMFGASGLFIGLTLLAISAPLMAGIGFGLALGSLLMYAGAVALLATSAIVAVAGAAMLVGGFLLNIAGGLMVSAAASFSLAGEGFIATSSRILIGSLMLAMAGPFMVSAGAMLVVGGLALAAAGAMLMFSLMFLADSSYVMLGIGTRIGVGGMMMLVGAQSLISAAGLLGGSAGYIDTSLSILIGLMPKMIAVAAMMLPVGVALQLASFALITAAFTISIAGSVLSIGSLNLLFGVIILNTIANMMAIFAPSMIVSGLMLSFASVLLLGSSVSLMAAGMLMVGASTSLMIGTITLFAAMVFLIPTATMMIAIGIAMFGGALLLGAGVQMLYVAAVGLATAAFLLSPASDMTFTSMQMLSVAAQIALTTGTLLSAASLVIMSAALSLAMAVIAIAATSLLITYTAPIFLGAMLVMWVGAVMLGNAASIIFIWSLLLAASGSLLLSAASNIFNSMALLAEAGKIAIVSSAILDVGVMSMMSTALLMVTASALLVFAGIMLAPASVAIYSGLLWMEFAISRFSKTIDKVQKVGFAMALLADAFVKLHNIPTGGLRDLSTEMLGALPNIGALGDGLVVAAAKLDAGVRAFQGPAERLNTILKELTETIVAFGQGLNLTDDVGKLAEMLDNYANLLENASERIETAVATKAMPAIKSAEQAGLEETVRSEAISTVQVIDKTDGGARETKDQNALLMAKMTETLLSIDTKLTEMQTGGRGELSEIVALLQAYLPGLGKGDSALGSEMNSWAK